MREGARYRLKTASAVFYFFKSAEPQTNVHKDVGTYRFNHAANENEIEYDKQQVFKRVDRKPSHTGQESSHGTFYDEGVAG